MLSPTDFYIDFKKDVPVRSVYCTNEFIMFIIVIQIKWQM